jgi:CheY-like chemotaxis protein
MVMPGQSEGCGNDVNPRGIAYKYKQNNINLTLQEFVMPAKTGLYLLLIDPDEDLCFLVKSLLELAGCRVDTAGTCAEALEKAGARRPDVILTELLLNDSTGLDIARKIRSSPQTKNAHLIAMTGYCRAGIVQAALEAGFHRYLLKPIQYQELIDVLTPLAAKLDASINPIGFLDLAASAA